MAALVPQITQSMTTYLNCHAASVGEGNEEVLIQSAEDAADVGDVVEHEDAAYAGEAQESEVEE